MTISVSVFGDVLDFLIDSGSTYSLLDRRVAEEHAVPLLQEVSWVDAAGMRTVSPRARVPLQLGGIGGLEIVTTVLVPTIPLSYGVKGFIGADILRQYDVTLEEAMLVLGPRVIVR